MQDNLADSGSFIMKKMVSPAKVLLYGHSFINHYKRWSDQQGGRFDNLAMGQDKVRVYYHGVGGATIAHMGQECNLDRVRSIKPDVVFIQLGTNDLAMASYGPEWVVDRMKELVLEILAMGVQRVIVGQVLFRGVAGLKRAVPNFRGKVIVFNHQAESTINGIDKAVLWKHHNMWKYIEQLVADDGTHLNDRCHYKYYRSLKGAVLLALKFIGDTRRS